MSAFEELDGQIILVSHRKGLLMAWQASLLDLGPLAIISDADNAITKISESAFDLVMIDARLDDPSTSEFIELMEMMGISAKYWVIDDGGSESDDCVDLSIIDQDALYNLLKSVLGAGTKAVADAKQAEEPEIDLDMLPIIIKFKNRLLDYVPQLEQAHTDQDLETYRKLLHNIKGAGGSLGFPVISQQAAEFETIIKQGIDNNFSEHHQSFISCCSETIKRIESYE